jgi:2-polyprenyl-3-methyl-5-hydroxy-6-metoxy-1,4-benzoquinol methylase
VDLVNNLFQIETNHPVALKSLDHLSPSGTANDSYYNHKFNLKLLELFERRPISVLDIGCAGGGMVKTFIDMDQIAVGIEGSDFSQIRRRSAWRFIPDNLFTADATYPFTMRINGEPFKFDVVTVWEFMEHINVKDLPAVFDNIDRHLKADGLIIGTINTRAALRHQTVKERGWWFDLFEQYGFIYDKALVEHFGNDWVRNAVGSFRIVMRRTQ